MPSSPARVGWPQRPALRLLKYLLGGVPVLPSCGVTQRLNGETVHVTAWATECSTVAGLLCDNLAAVNLDVGSNPARQYQLTACTSSAPA